LSKKIVTGCRFSLSVMSDSYVNMIVGAIKKVNTANVWSATDALSTTYRGRREHVLDGVKGVFTAVNDGRTHITMEAAFSKGCPNDSDDDYVLAEDGTLLNQSSEKFGVLSKIAFYPLGTERYMEHISAVIKMARERGIFGKISHYATEISGDVNEIFGFLGDALEYAEKNTEHYVLQTTLSVNSPSLQGGK